MYKITTKPRDQKTALSKELKQTFTERDFFKAQEKFEQLTLRKELKVVLFGHNGEILDHN